MPLGIFGGSSVKDGGPKPQPLTSEEKTPTKKEKAAGTSNHNHHTGEIKDAKGSTVKLSKKTYTFERKLAEGGFAIVYLVTDKHNRNYALKRQLIRDDPRQVEACRTESQIVKNLSGHKNIVEYVDHQLAVNKTGVHDYMLLTTYYPENVLQLMNSRLLVNRCLTANEVLDIFCDICSAIARLHHSKTPVIHRDLKVENVLIDRRAKTERPTYVLCDFGSATTKVLSKEHYTHAFMEEEIQRYTTLSYRAPEMIDLFSGIPIDTKSDIWALGILLFKLCYFSLPFGESTLAIQSGVFSFPESPPVSDGIKAIINLTLTLSAPVRPNIYQTAHLAFSCANRKCPVLNIEKSPRIELNEAIQILHLRDKLGSNYFRLFEKAINDFEAQKRRHTIPADNNVQQQPPVGTAAAAAANLTLMDKMETENQTMFTTDSAAAAAHSSNNKVLPPEGVIVTTGGNGKDSTAHQMHPRSATTSVNPRLRPKPQIASTTVATSATTTAATVAAAAVATTAATTSTTITHNHQKNHVSTGVTIANATTTTNAAAAVGDEAKFIGYHHGHHEFRGMAAAASSEQPTSTAALERLAAAAAGEAKASKMHGHGHPAATGSHPTTSRSHPAETGGGVGAVAAAPRLPHLSAFQPYSLLAKTQHHHQPMPLMIFEPSNPFAAAQPSLLASPGAAEAAAANMDDNMFGEHFDAIRRVVRDPDADSKKASSTKLDEKDFAGRLSLGGDDAASLGSVTQQSNNSSINIFQLPQRVYRDWAVIEEEMGDDPFANAPPIVYQQQYSKQ